MNTTTRTTYYYIVDINDYKIVDNIAFTTMAELQHWANNMNIRIGEEGSFRVRTIS